MDSLHLRDLFHHLIRMFGLNVEKLLCCDKCSFIWPHHEAGSPSSLKKYQPYFTVQIGKSCRSSCSTMKAGAAGGGGSAAAGGAFYL